jgi:hypothetical protein
VTSLGIDGAVGGARVAVAPELATAAEAPAEGVPGSSRSGAKLTPVGSVSVAASAGQPPLTVWVHDVSVNQEDDPTAELSGTTRLSAVATGCGDGLLAIGLAADSAAGDGAETAGRSGCAKERVGTEGDSGGGTKGDSGTEGDSGGGIEGGGSGIGGGDSRTGGGARWPHRSADGTGSGAVGLACDLGDVPVRGRPGIASSAAVIACVDDSAAHSSVAGRSSASPAAEIHGAEPVSVDPGCRLEPGSAARAAGREDGSAPRAAGRDAGSARAVGGGPACGAGGDDGPARAVGGGGPACGGGEDDGSARAWLPNRSFDRRP